jgi:hypothetical protein
MRIKWISVALILAAVWAIPAFAEDRPGLGVDSHGGGVIDPTKNVLDKVLDSVTRLNDLMAADRRRADDLREADAKLQNAARDAETRRVNELAAQKQGFDLELARGIRANQEASALLLATAVRDLKTDTSDRIAKLEQFANEQRGRSSATDPAYSKLLEDVRSLIARQADSSGQGVGQANMFGWIVAGAMLLITVGALFYRREKHP